MAFARTHLRKRASDLYKSELILRSKMISRDQKVGGSIPSGGFHIVWNI